MAANDGEMTHREDESPFSHIKHPGKKAFLRALAQCGRVTHAARAAGLSSYDIIYSRPWKTDEEFQAGLTQAMEIYSHRLEDEAIRRAVEGDRQYKFGQGGVVLRHPEKCVCGHDAQDHLKDLQTQERNAGRCASTGQEGLCDCEAFLGAPYWEDKRSDTMLIFTMKGMMPGKYGDRVELRGALANLDVARLPHHMIARLAAGENPLEVLSSGAERALLVEGRPASGELVRGPDATEPASPVQADAGSELEEDEG